MRPSAGPDLRPWSRSARASANASGTATTTTSNYLADDFHRVLRHRELAEFRAGPEGNGVAERFIRTLKENLLWVRSFDTIEEPAWPCLRSSERTTSSGCWRNTTIVPLRCDVTVGLDAAA